MEARLSGSFATFETLDLFRGLEKPPSGESIFLDEGVSLAAARTNGAAANQDDAEMTRLAQELMSRLVGDSIARTLASYMENQDIKGL